MRAANRNKCRKKNIQIGRRFKQEQDRSMVDCQSPFHTQYFLNKVGCGNQGPKKVLSGICPIWFNYFPTCSLKDSSCFRALRSSSCCLSATRASCFSQTSFSSIFMANSISCLIPIWTSSSFSTSWNTQLSQHYLPAFFTINDVITLNWCSWHWSHNSKVCCIATASQL